MGDQVSDEAKTRPGGSLAFNGRESFGEAMLRHRCDRPRPLPPYSPTQARGDTAGELRHGATPDAARCLREVGPRQKSFSPQGWSPTTVQIFDVEEAKRMRAALLATVKNSSEVDTVRRAALALLGEVNRA